MSRTIKDGSACPGLVGQFRWQRSVDTATLSLSVVYKAHSVTYKEAFAFLYDTKQGTFGTRVHNIPGSK